MILMIYKLVTFGAVIFGAIICSRRKIIIHSMSSALPLAYILLFGVIYAESQKGKIFLPILVVGGLIIIGLLMLRGRYKIYNISKDTLVPLINGVLDKNNIKYENEKSGINLTESKCEITLNEALNITYIDMHKITNTRYYPTIRDQIKKSLNLTNKKYFSYVGILYIVFAMFLFAIRIRGIR